MKFWRWISPVCTFQCFIETWVLTSLPSDPCFFWIVSPKRSKTQNSLPQYFSKVAISIIFVLYLIYFHPWLLHIFQIGFTYWYFWFFIRGVRKSILEAIGVGLRNRMNFGGLVGQLQPLTDQHINFRVIVDAMFGSEGSSDLESVGWWPPECAPDLRQRWM